MISFCVSDLIYFFISSSFHSIANTVPHFTNFISQGLKIFSLDYSQLLVNCTSAFDSPPPLYCQSNLSEDYALALLRNLHWSPASSQCFSKLSSALPTLPALCSVAQNHHCLLFAPKLVFFFSVSVYLFMTLHLPKIYWVGEKSFIVIHIEKQYNNK